MNTGKGLVAEANEAAALLAGPALNKCRTVTNVGGALSYLGKDMALLFHVF